MDWHDLLNGLGGPLLAVLFGIAGVVLGRFIAQGVKREGEDRITTKVNVALAVLFSLAAIGYVRDNPTVSPLRVLGYGGAAGFIGLPLLEWAANFFSERLKGALDGFMNPTKRHMVVANDDIENTLKTAYKIEEEHPDGKSQ